VIGWLGIWPLPLVLALVGATIMCFPDGRFPSSGWRLVFGATLAAAVVLAVTSASWPVDYDRSGLVVDHPFRLSGADAAQSFFDVARPVCFTGFQLLWLGCVVRRYLAAPPDEARQLRWLVSAIALSVLALVAGLVADGSPMAGLLAWSLVPVAAGIAIVESSYDTLVREVQSSAKRVVSAQDEARRRIERDLHDGAQHRLVVLGMELGRLVDRAEAGGDPAMVASAAAARTELLAATEELRELARGIHPSVLTQDGLAPALASLADRSPLPVRLTVEVPEPCAPEVEATAYFVVCEALTNAARYSGAGQVTVDVSRTAFGLRLDVADDGRGGATLGSGLRGLADRVASLGGRLSLHDDGADCGTRLAVDLPCE
jgi:signal transduction histidine kinase